MREPFEPLPGETPRIGWRVWAWPFVVCLLIGSVFGLSKAGFLPWGTDVLAQAGQFAGSPWGLPILVGVFCAGAFLGVPQFALMAAAMVAFGPWPGAVYAWLATLCSGGVTYWAGRAGGQALFARFAGARAHKVSAFLGRNAFQASAFVRLIPSGPFILVNMAFGVSRARFFPFLAGLALGAWPKLILVALTTRGLIAAEAGAMWLAIAAGTLVVLVWGGVVWLGRGQQAGE